MKKIAVVCVLISTYLVGCSSGVSDPVSSKLPAGPVSYSYINTTFDSSILTSSTQNVVSLLSEPTPSNCGSVMADTGTGLVAVSGFLSLIPVAGPAIGGAANAAGASLGLFGAIRGNNCINQTLENMQQQLTTQQNQINNIESALNLMNNEFWGALTTQSEEILSIDYGNYNNNVSAISTFAGLNGLMQNAGLVNVLGIPVPNYSIESNLIENPKQYASLYSFIGSENVNSYLAGIKNSTNNPIQDIAGFSFPNTASNSSSVIMDQWSPPIFQPNTNANYIKTLASLYDFLNNNMTSSLSAQPYVNVVPLIDQYNQAINGLYQQSLYAIALAYQTSYFINMVNYNTYISSNGSPENRPYLNNLNSGQDGIGGYVYYNPNNFSALYPSIDSSINSQTQFYNMAQRNLSMLYAAIVNQLYINTIQYLITDQPVGAQSYPDSATFSYSYNSNGQIIESTTSEKVNYTGNIGNKVVSAISTLFGAVNASVPINGPNLYASLLSAIHSANGYATLFYQVPGLVNNAACLNALSQYNEVIGATGSIQEFYGSDAGASCNASILPTVNNSAVTASIVDWNTIQPYYVSNAVTLPTLYGSVTNNISACNTGSSVGSIPAANLYVYTPNGVTLSLGTSNVPYLMCGNWSTANFQEQIVIPTTSSTWESAMSIVGQASYSSGSMFTYLTAGGVSSNITFMDGAFENWSSNGLSNNNLPYGTTQQNIYYGWMQDNYPIANQYNTVTNNAAVQIMLPDGLIIPLYISVDNIADAFDSSSTAQIGYYFNLESNTALSSVLIDGNPLIGSISNPICTTYTTSMDSSSPKIYTKFCANQLSINNNVLVMGGVMQSYDKNLGNGYIYLNPISCNFGPPVTTDGTNNSFEYFGTVLGSQSITCTN